MRSVSYVGMTLEGERLLQLGELVHAVLVDAYVMEDDVSIVVS